MGIYTPTEVLLKVYLKRIMEANSIDPGTFTLRAKTGLDASRHPWFRWREGLNPTKDTPYQNITVMGMFINQSFERLKCSFVDAQVLSHFEKDYASKIKNTHITLFYGTPPSTFDVNALQCLD